MNDFVLDAKTDTFFKGKEEYLVLWKKKEIWNVRDNKIINIKWNVRDYLLLRKRFQIIYYQKYNAFFRNVFKLFKAFWDQL